MFEIVYLSLGAWGLIYSLSTAVGIIIMSVIVGGVLMALLAILSNVCLSLNGGLIGSWLAFLIVGAHQLQNH